MGVRTYEKFLATHSPQLERSGIPQHYWKTLFEKLTHQTFDSGNAFTLTQIAYDEEPSPYDVVWQLRVKLEEGIRSDDSNHIYLVDHAWTFKMETAREELKRNGILKERMASIVGLDSDSETSKILSQLWKYCNFYSIGNAEGIENRLPIWFVMDEVGSGIQHDENPNFRMVPFIYLDEQIAFSLIFPIRNLNYDEVVTRDFIEGITDAKKRCALSVPFLEVSLSDSNYDFVKANENYFLSGHIEESLPDLEFLRNHIEKKTNYKIYCEYNLIEEYLTDSRFEFVDNENEADILWYTKHFKNYHDLSKTPHKFVNQFPFEYVITIKDLLCIICRGKNLTNFDETLNSLPRWLPTTYNLQTELIPFINYFKKRQESGLDNLWIIKPFNFARGLDTYITDDLNCILRSSITVPKISQKYIENPIVFYREDIGKVKFDVRYVILLKSAKPLEIYVYKKFFLRFANQPFELDSFDEYEKHFTVMNYTENAQLKKMLCDEFKEKWNEQYSEAPWDSVEDSILSMLKEVFECAVLKGPPCGIAESPQSRAVYAADVMLEWTDGDKVQPKLLEINWTPDCERACKYYNEFYNDIFKFMFFNELNTDVIRKI